MEPQAFSDFLVKYPNSLNNFVQLKALLNDCFPTEREETVPLLFAFDLGIVEKIQESVLDASFVDSFVQTLMTNYGADQYRSEKATLLWCYSYGVSILHKACSVDASEFFESLQTGNNTPEIDSDGKYTLEQAASDYEQGMALYRSEDYIGAVKLYEASAAFGYAEAQYALGSCYEKGTGVPRSPKEAVKLYKKAAEQDYVLAESRLASAFFSGEGIHRNYDNALYWAQKAATQGDDSSMIIIGKIYEDGLTGSRDFFEAYKWYRQAAEHGHIEAMYKVANFLVIGRAVERNPSEAAYWNKKAAEAGHEKAMFNLGQQYIQGDGVSVDHSLALYWIREAARNGHTQAMNALLQMGLM